MTHDWQYSGGQGWGIVGPRVAVLVPADHVAAAQRLWAAVDAGADAEGALAELLRDGLDRLGSFVLVEGSAGGVRVLLRGSGTAVVVGSDRPPAWLFDEGGRAWRDEFVPGVVGAQVGLGPTAGLGQDCPADPPLRAGVVRTDRLTGTPAAQVLPVAADPPDRLPEPTPPTPVAVPPRPLAESPAAPAPSPAAWEPPSVFMPPAAWPPPSATADPGLTLLPPEEPPPGEVAPEPWPAPAQAPVPTPSQPPAPVSAAPPAELPPDVDPVYLQLVSGHTVIRTVEGAAVRPGAELDDAPAPSAPPAERPPGPAGADVAAEPAPPPVQAGVISSMPFGLGGAPGASQAPAPAPAPEPEPVRRPVSAVFPSAAAAAPPTVPHPDDETGLTIARVARDMGAVDAQGVPLAGRAGWLSSLVCPVGHANPPVEASCRVCGQSLAGAVPQLMERPVIGRLTFDGPPGVVVVTRSLVVGRKPTVDRVAGADVPDLVPVPTNDGGVSRSHVRIGVDGWHVTVEDLHATNGTVVVEPDGTQRRLRPGEERLLVPGCRVVLGDTVSFRFGTRP